MTPEEDPRSGKWDEVSPGGFRLEHPVVQVFEKKAKPEATAAPTPPAPELPPTPPASLALGRPILRLKGRT